MTEARRAMHRDKARARGLDARVEGRCRTNGRMKGWRHAGGWLR